MKLKFFDIEICNGLWNLTRTFNNSLLMWSAEDDYIEFFKLLLSKPGIDVNCQNICMQNQLKILILFRPFQFFQLKILRQFF